MKILIMALAFLVLIPTVQAINITCDSDYVCDGDYLRRVHDCSFTNITDPFPLYLDAGTLCEFGCDSEYNQCVIPPYYEVIILFVIIFGGLLIARWVFVKKTRGKRR